MLRAKGKTALPAPSLKQGCVAWVLSATSLGNLTSGRKPITPAPTSPSLPSAESCLRPESLQTSPSPAPCLAHTPPPSATQPHRLFWRSSPPSLSPSFSSLRGCPLESPPLSPSWVPVTGRDGRQGRDKPHLRAFWGRAVSSRVKGNVKCPPPSCSGQLPEGPTLVPLCPLLRGLSPGKGVTNGTDPLKREGTDGRVRESEGTAGSGLSLIIQSL